MVEDHDTTQAGAVKLPTSCKPGSRSRAVTASNSGLFDAPVDKARTPIYFIGDLAVICSGLEVSNDTGIVLPRGGGVYLPLFVGVHDLTSAKELLVLILELF